jgi:hypothetical protein
MKAQLSPGLIVVQFMGITPFLDAHWAKKLPAQGQVLPCPRPGGQNFFSLAVAPPPVKGKKVGRTN